MCYQKYKKELKNWKGMSLQDVFTTVIPFIIDKPF